MDRWFAIVLAVTGCHGREVDPRLPDPYDAGPIADAGAADSGGGVTFRCTGASEPTCTRGGLSGTAYCYHVGIYVWADANEATLLEPLPDEPQCNYGTGEWMCFAVIGEGGQPWPRWIPLGEMEDMLFCQVE